MKKISIALRIIDSVRIALALTIIIAMVSCSKENVDTAHAAQPVAEKKIMESKNTADATDFQKYSYDGQGRLVKVESNASILNFEYQPFKMVMDYFSKTSNTSTGKKEYMLDASGRTTEVVSKKPDGSINYNQFIEYDAEGYLARAKTVYPDGEIYELRLTTSGGNVTREDAYTNNILEDRTDYFYDLTVKNKGYNSMALSKWGIKGLFGKEYENESNSFKRYNAAGTLKMEMTSTLVTDAEGYLKKRTISYPMTGQSREYQYIYQ